MFKLKKNLILILFITLFLVSCNNEESPTENNQIKFQANLTYQPSFTPAGTEYLFNFYAVVDDVLDTENYLFRFDVDNDGTFEQDWSENSSYTLAISQPDALPFRLDVKSSEGQIASCTGTVYVITKITQPHNEGSWQGDAVWDKSGSNKIAFTWKDQIGSGIHDLFVVDYTTGVITQLASGKNGECKHFPEWSADGSKIYFKYNNSISYVNVATKEVDTLIDNVDQFVSLACSKDGKYLYFCGGTIAGYGLHKYTFSTNTLEKISNFSSHPITISPDGTKIAAGFNELSIFDLTQLEVVKTYNTKIQEDRIEWSPNGRYIALNYNDSTNSVRILDLEKEEFINLKIVGLSGIQSWGFTWSPDGTKLAFTGTQSGYTHGSLWSIKTNLE